MAKVISLISGKGGVGKTTIATNLAYFLGNLGYETILVDTNLTTPHLGLQLGFLFPPKTLHDALKSEEDISKILYPHPLGFKFVPGSIVLEDLADTDINKLAGVISTLAENSDFVLLDAAPGFGREATSTLTATESVLVVTTPEMPSVVDALKSKKLAEDLGKIVLGVVVNRVKKHPMEMKKYEIEEMLECPVIAEVPEEKNIIKSTVSKAPLVHLFPNSRFSLEIQKIVEIVTEGEYQTPRGFFYRFLGWLRR